jgi:hypothetical protein
VEVLGILLKLVVIAWALNLMRCYATGARMWAPYHTLANTPGESLWRAYYAALALAIFLATSYWLAADLFH